VLFAAQMVDGHLHKAPHNGVIVHCGPYLLETVIRDYHVVNTWVMNEKERPVAVGDRSIRVRVVETKQELALKSAGDHFEVGLSSAPGGGTMHFDVELRDGRRTYKAAVLWRNIDDMDRMNRAGGFK
jgi:hypothetical protein